MEIPLVNLGKKYPNVVCVGGDTTDSLKTKKFGEKFPDRLFNVGIAEANLSFYRSWPCYCG